MMRTTAGNKVTMAEANGIMKHESEGETRADDPDMPHLRLDPHQLLAQYPPLVVPDDLHGESDLEDDDNDGIIIEGNRIIDEIIQEAKTHGRRRHMRERGDGRAAKPGTGRRRLERCSEA